jgi:putative DNA primase/helicase
MNDFPITQVSQVSGVSLMQAPAGEAPASISVTVSGLLVSGEQVTEVSEVSGVQPAAHQVLGDTPATSARYQETAEVSCTNASDLPEPGVRAGATIPDENERPCFRVLDDSIEVAGQKYRAGVWHFGVKPGRQGAPATLTQHWVCSPLHVDAVTTDAQGGNFGRQLRFKTTLGSWRTWAMPMELLRGDGSDLRGELLAMGLEIDPSSRNVLALYLQAKAPKRRIQCALQTGWAGPDFLAFVLPDTVIGPKSSAVAYQSGQRENDEFTTGGTLAGWQQEIGAMAVDNPLLMLALSAAFAGPLLALCNAESGGIHFVGDSSTGKTTAVKAACSIWGGAGFCRSWRATSNGMEGVAALRSDSLLALDEVGECDPREVGAIVYALGNGIGKQRASRTGSARAVARYRCSVLSSGERTIGTIMAEGGHRIKAGQSMRLLDVPAQRAYGAWDKLHHHPSGTAFSDALKRAAATQYGHAGREFLEELTRDQRNFDQALELIKMLPGLQAKGDEGQARRAAARFSLLALAGELAIEYGVAPWPKGAAIEAAAVAFHSWQLLRGKASGNLERDQVLERVAAFIERHGDSRFSNIRSGDDQRLAMIRDRAGWWEDKDGTRLFLFTADGMREAVKGFDFNRALDALEEVGAIDSAAADGKRAKFRRVDGIGVRLYVVNPAAFDPVEG